MQPGNEMQPYQGGYTEADLQQFGIDADMFTGLEQFGAEDARLNRVAIHHKEGGWIEESLSGVQYPDGIWFIPLAFIKQRIMWRAAMVDDAVPLCKSTDYKHGFPTIGDKDPKNNYPWGAAGLNQADMSISEENDRVVIPCDVCSLKDWGTHPVKDTAWCGQQRVVPMLFAAKGDVPDQLGVMTFRNTSLGPCNAFFAGIGTRKIRGTNLVVPAYSVIGEITLSPRLKGTNDFMVPIFKRVRDTDMAEWRGYSEQARVAYDYLTRAPRGEEKEPVDPDDVVSGTGKNGYQPPATQTMAPPAGVQQPAPRVMEAQYVTPPPTQAPVQAAPVQAAPVQAAPVQAPAQPVPVAQAPVQAPVQQAPAPVEETWPTSPPAPAQFPPTEFDDDELPF